MLFFSILMLGTCHTRDRQDGDRHGREKKMMAAATKPMALNLPKKYWNGLVQQCFESGLLDHSANHKHAFLLVLRTHHPCSDGK